MKRAIIVVALLVLPTLSTWGDLSEPESLRDLDDVMVIVERLHPDADEVNLSRAVVELDVRKQLREADVPVLATNDRDAHPHRPYLYVNCNLLYVAQIGLTTFSIDVELHQRVTLENGEKAKGLTWSKSYLGVQGKESAAQKVREIVAQHVNQFILDYNAANASTERDNDDSAA